MTEYVMLRPGAAVETTQSELYVWAHHRTTEIANPQTVAQHGSWSLMCNEGEAALVISNGWPNLKP